MCVSVCGFVYATTGACGSQRLQSPWNWRDKVLGREVWYTLLIAEPYFWPHSTISINSLTILNSSIVKYLGFSAFKIIRIMAFILLIAYCLWLESSVLCWIEMVKVGIHPSFLMWDKKFIAIFCWVLCSEWVVYM